jgi:ComF family protein
MRNLLLHFLARLGFCPCCLLCRQRLTQYQRICEDCVNVLPWVDLAHLSCPRVFDDAVIALEYLFPVDQLILGGKFSRQLSSLTLLAELFVRKWQTAGLEKPDVLIPMPLHVKRLRERGYNQALEIARVIGKQLDIPVKVDAALRVKATLPQASLPARRRSQNVKNAFVGNSSLQGMRIAIVDDVFTTGSTAAALAAVLKQQGAVKIDLYCVARTNK